MSDTKKKSMKPSVLRLLSASALLVVIALGLVFSTGLGTPSSFGIDAIAAVCPVGILETFLAKWVVTPHGLICLVITVMLVLVFGRVFCGWFCPIPLTKRLFEGRKHAAKEHSDLKDICAGGCSACKFSCGMRKGDTVASDAPGAVAASTSDAPTASTATVTHTASVPASPAAATGAHKKIRIMNSPLDSRHAVLFGALASSAIFGFPVFCLVCPVGLTIATFIALWYLFTRGTVTLSLVIFPLIVLVELLFLRKWCHRFCPISAALSLVSKGNKTLKPTVDPTKCIREKGEAPCHACYNACPESIDLHDLMSGAPANECMKCRECVAACPAGAISFPFMPVPVREGTQVALASIPRRTASDRAAKLENPET